MEDLIFAPLVVLVGIGIHLVVLKWHTQRFEHRLLNLSFLAHLVAGVGMVLVYTYYYTAGGDMISYHAFGVPMAEALRYDFESVFPEMAALFFHQEYTLPLESVGVGSTGTMQAVAVGLFYLLGNSLYASALFITVFSYLAKVLIYWAIKRDFAHEDHEKILFAIALSPTGIAWTCAVLKEPVLMVFFGPAILGIRWILEGRRLFLGAGLVIFGSLFILLLKPYVLLAFTLAGGVWILWSRTLRSGENIAVKPAYFLVAVSIVALGFTVVSTYFPSLSPDKVAESMQQQRRLSAMEQGGSNFYLEDRQAPVVGPSQPSLASQVGLVPLALITALFRPFIFESFSAMQVLNSVEMAWLTVLFIQVVRRNGWARLLKRVTANPALMFSVVFVFVLALGTGLSTSNLGTLSRYRAPMMPFFLLLLLVLRDPERAAAPQVTTAQA